MKQHIVLKVRSNLPNKRDYLQPHVYAGGMPVRFDAEEAERFVQEIELRHQEQKDGAYPINGAFPVFVGNKSDLDVFRLAKRLAGAQLQPNSGVTA